MAEIIRLVGLIISGFVTLAGILGLILAYQDVRDRDTSSLLLSIILTIIGTTFIIVIEKWYRKNLKAQTQSGNYRCSNCNKELEEIGIPPQIQFIQQYRQVINIGSEQVPEEIKNDPYLYRGFFCRACKKVFCPSCSHMQGEVCPRCGQRQLMPAYRPLLKGL
jgi:DNA-directed RNA polymerase subunit RPC12/RpoP